MSQDEVGPVATYVKYVNSNRDPSEPLSSNLADCKSAARRAAGVRIPPPPYSKSSVNLLDLAYSPLLIGPSTSDPKRHLLTTKHRPHNRRPSVPISAGSRAPTARGGPVRHYSDTWLEGKGPERMMGFSDRVCLVTGGGRGIGAATARRFAAEGAAVAVATSIRDRRRRWPRGSRAKAGRPWHWP